MSASRQSGSASRSGGSSQVAIVTGSSSGIGCATASRLLTAGYCVVVCARDTSRLELAAESFEASNRVLPVVCDMRVRDQVDGLVASTLEAFGRIDRLVVAHGAVGLCELTADATDGDWHSVLETNLVGAMRICRASTPSLISTAGAIVLVSSLSAFQAEPGLGAYGASEAGLESFARHLASELAPHAVRVNSVAPGWVRTPATLPLLDSAEMAAKPLDCNFLQRAAEPDEVAGIIEFLLSDDASFINGECLVVDGGQRSRLSPLRPAKSAAS